MSAIRINCPACGKLLEVDRDSAGKEVECGECFEVFVAKAPESKPRGTPSPAGKIPAASTGKSPAVKTTGKPRKRRRDDDDDHYDHDDADDEDYDPRPRHRRRYRDQKSRVAYIILALFLGSWGVHNFYAGRTGPATSQLIITAVSIPLICVIVGLVTIWIPVIWAIVDIITVTEDGNGVPMS